MAQSAGTGNPPTLVFSSVEVSELNYPRRNKYRNFTSKTSNMMKVDVNMATQIATDMTFRTGPVDARLVDRKAARTE